jgi:hypothetical protein
MLTNIAAIAAAVATNNRLNILHLLMRSLPRATRNIIFHFILRLCNRRLLMLSEMSLFAALPTALLPAIP